MSALEDWTRLLCAELGIDREAADIGMVLGLARDVAHTVDRPAAPVTAYLLGVAIGRDGQAADAVARVRQLVSEWTAQAPAAGGGNEPEPSP